MNLTYSRKAYDKILYWVDKADFEVSGFGTVTWDEADKCFVVHDAILIKQEGGSAHTDIDPTALSQAMYRARELPGELKLWWHSHVNMQVFWSGQDLSTIKELGAQGWIVASVFNKKEEVRSAFCARVDMPIIGIQAHVVDDIKTMVEGKEVEDDLDKEYDACVSEKKFSPTLYQGHQTLEGKTWDYEKKEWKEGPAATPVGKPVSRIEPTPDGYTENAWRVTCEEAAMLRMSPEDYDKLLKTGNSKQLDKINQRLNRAYEEMEMDAYYGKGIYHGQ